MRNNHKLKENAFTHTPLHILTYDCETDQIENEDKTKTHFLKVGVVRFWSKEKDRIYQDEFVFHTIKEFWDYVESKTNYKTRTYLIAHNQQFDSLIVDMFNEMPKRGWSLDHPIIDSNLFILEWNQGIHGCKKENIKSKMKTLVCLDSLNFFKSSLKEIGKTLGLPKGEIEFDKCTMDELITYCKRDVEITELIMLKWFEFIRINDLGNVQPTLASQAFSAFRHRFMHHDIYIHNNQKAIKLERDSYRGGRNEAFKLGEINNKIYVLDFNSLYPSVMKGNPYPTDLKSFTFQNNMRTLKEAMNRYLVIAELTVKLDQPIMAVKDSRLIFPIGEFTSVFTTPEIEVLLKRDCIISIGRMATYEFSNIFDSYIDFFYNERLKAKKAGNKVENEMLKIMLNSLYGKFGQRMKKNEKIGIAENDNITVERCIHPTSKEIFMRKTYAGNVYRTLSTQDESYDSFPAIASFCTSYARMKLLDAIEKAGWENVYYVDTDSLFVNEKGFKNLHSMIDQSKLGYLKLEYTAFNMTINGCKDYFINTPIESHSRHDAPISNLISTKIKGVPKKATKINENEYSILHFDKFATALQKGSLSHVTERQVIKKLSRKYTKGIVYQNGAIRPFMKHYNQTINIMNSENEFAPSLMMEKRRMK